MKTVLYTNSARKALRGLATDAQDAIKAKLTRYAENGSGDVTKLQGTEGARLRVGDYRAIFIETDEAVEVRAVGHRREIYR